MLSGDAQIYDLSGQPIALSSFWAEQVAVLVFLRHYG